MNMFTLAFIKCPCAIVLAQAKSGDVETLGGYIGNSYILYEAMIKFSFTYTGQNEKDYRALAAAAKSKE